MNRLPPYRSIDGHLYYLRTTSRPLHMGSDRVAYGAG